MNRILALRVATMVAFLFILQSNLPTSQDLHAQYRPLQQVRRVLRGPTVSTRNFQVTAPTESFARRVANEAERFRKELALEWLGHELQPWAEKCPIQVKIEPHAGGVTRFGFRTGPGRSQPVEWEMEIFGPPDRILDSVLPHEVTHTIFATHFGRPLPRWADEGACTTVEHESEKRKNHQMLMQFLSSRPSRGIPFNRMFSMRDYPRDILPLYAQGYSLAKFLIQQRGKRDFVRYVETGLRNEDQGMGLEGWGKATNKVYGYEDLNDLQIEWQAWVRKGSPRLNRRRVVAASQTRNTPAKKTSTVQPVPQAPCHEKPQPGKSRTSWPIGKDHGQCKLALAAETGFAPNANPITG